MLIAAIIFLAAMLQSMMGFGMALIAMPLLVAVLGIQAAPPLFALLGVAATSMNTLRWRGHIVWRDVISMAAPALVAIPLGVWFLGRGDPDLVTALLGMVLIGYVIVSVLKIPLPVKQSRQWATGVGLLSGFLTGAFNTGGPPLVVYASACDWTPDCFRANLQSTFLVIGLTVCVAHGLNSNLTPDIWKAALLALPALLLGQLAGVAAGRRFSPLWFRRLVYGLLVVLGINLII